MAAPETELTDKTIADEIAKILEAQSQIPAGAIQVEVHKGVVVLSGEVDDEFSRLDAEKKIDAVRGIKFVDNEITIRKPGSAPAAPFKPVISAPVPSAASGNNSLFGGNLSNSQALFDQISKALYRAGMFVSYADLQGGAEAWHEEMKAIDIVLHVMQKQSSKDSFVGQLTQLAAGQFESLDSYKFYPDPAQIKNLQQDLASVPEETEAAVKAVLENFSKDDARVYADLLLSVSAAAGKAYDKKDDMYLTGNVIVDTVTFAANAQHLIDRTLRYFSQLQQDETARYLYDENNIFDQMPIGDKDTIALQKLSSAARQAWLEKYPKDLTQTVPEYLKEHPEEA